MKKKLSIAFAVMLLASLLALPAMAKQSTSAFEAEFTAIFAITGDAGKSVNFIVAESGADGQGQRPNQRRSTGLQAEASPSLERVDFRPPLRIDE